MQVSVLTGVFKPPGAWISFVSQSAAEGLATPDILFLSFLTDGQAWSFLSRPSSVTLSTSWTRGERCKTGVQLLGLGMAVHTYSASTHEAETGAYRFRGQPGLYSEALFPKGKEKKAESRAGCSCSCL